MQCLFLSLCHPCARMHIIMHACTHIFKHFSIAVSTLLSFKRLWANHWEEKQEVNVASCTFLWLARQVQAEQRRQGPAIWQKHNCMHTPLKRPTNGMSTNRANKTTGAAVNQTFLKRLAACLQLWTANLSELAGSMCMYVHACLCVLSRDSFTSAAVLLCSSWRQRCSRWMGIACCLHTHSAQSPAQMSAPTSPLLRTQACTTHTHTRSLCFQLCRVYAGPFSSIWILSLSLSLAVTLPPIHPHRLPPPSLYPSLLLSDSLGCDNPFWQLMLFLGQS